MFSPISLFSAGEQGVWLDPSDLTTMFQDRAGTTPVTTPGQTVGLRLDKSKGLALGPEIITNGDFSNGGTGWISAGWVISEGKATISNVSASLTQNVTLVAGRSYQFEYTLSAFSGTGAFRPRFFGGTTVTGTSRSANGTYVEIMTAVSGNVQAAISVTTATCSGSVDNISVKELPGNHAVAPTDAARPTYGIEPKTGRRNLLLATDTMATQSLTVTAAAHTLAFTGTGTVILTGASIAGPLIGTGASNRVRLTFTPIAASLTLTVVGSVTLAQLELGSTATAYQRVGTSFDVTEDGVATCHYVQYDGTDDSFSTSSVTAGTDKVQFFTGVRKLSDAAQRVVAEFSASTSTNNGTFNMQAPSGAGLADYLFTSKGTISSGDFASGYAAPVSNVLAGLGDISGDTATLRINSTQVAQSTTDQGTGNFLSYPLYIGRRNNATLPFNGREYGIIVRFGNNLDASAITNTESYLAANTSGVTL